MINDYLYFEPSTESDDIEKGIQCHLCVKLSELVQDIAVRKGVNKHLVEQAMKALKLLSEDGKSVTEFRVDIDEEQMGAILDDLEAANDLYTMGRMDQNIQPHVITHKVGIVFSDGMQAEVFRN